MRGTGALIVMIYQKLVTVLSDLPGFMQVALPIIASLFIVLLAIEYNHRKFDGVIEGIWLISRIAIIWALNCVFVIGHSRQRID